MTDAAVSPVSGPPAKTSAPRMTLPQQAVINLAAFMAVTIMADGRTTVVVDNLAEILPAAQKNVPPGLELMIRAAAGVVDAWPAARTRDGSLAWCRAMMRVQAELADVFFHRAVLAIDAHAQTTSPRPADAAA